MSSITQSLKTIVLALIIGLGINFAYAWTGPTSAPPNGNTSAPVNVSATAQVKSGGLWLGSLGTDGGASFAGSVGIGTASPAQKLDVNGGWIKLTGTGNGGDTATRIGVYDSDNTGGVSGWWLSQNQNGTFAVHQNGVGDRLTIDGSGNTTVAGQIYGPGAVSTYGGFSLNGTKNGWGGINFRSGGSNLGTLMVHPDYQGFYNDADSGWDWYWVNGTLAAGTVPAANIGAGTASGLSIGGNSGTVGGYGPGSFLKWNTWEYGNYYQTNGDIYMGWAGNWLSTVLSQKAGTGGYLVYSCPQISGGVGGSSTCVGGLSVNSTCSTTDNSNFTQSYGCTPLGHLVP